MTATIAAEACRACGKCREICQADCIQPQDGIYRVEQYDCINCGLCREVCPTGAARSDG